jgi:hypothetical protein
MDYPLFCFCSAEGGLPAELLRPCVHWCNPGKR